MVKMVKTNLDVASRYDKWFQNGIATLRPEGFLCLIIKLIYDAQKGEIC